MMFCNWHVILGEGGFQMYVLYIRIQIGIYDNVKISLVEQLTAWTW